MLPPMLDEDETLNIPTRVQTQAAPRAQYDPTYFARHDARNRSRIEAIMSNLPPGERLLDVGCNRGYFSRAALDLGLARRVDGVEPSRAEVQPELLGDPRFTLHEGDIFDLDLSGPYHAVIYCAVHHHVFGHRGRAAAFDLWQRLVSLCDRHLFFESGQLLEGSRWYWQRALRRHFPSDEQHFAELLQAVGPRLEAVKVIGKHSIHGTRRWLLRIDLRPIDTAPPRRHRETLAGGLTVLEELRRSVGSRRQRLVPISRPPGGQVVEGDPGTPLHDGVTLKLCQDPATGERLWCKRRPSDPFRDEREHMIGSQLAEPVFLRSRALDPELGLVFPYIEGEKLTDLRLHDIENKEQLLEQLIDLYEKAERLVIATGELDIDPRERHCRRALIDLIDLHASNILVARDGNGLRLLGVIDLEYYRNHNHARNAMHLAKTLIRAHATSPRALRWIARAYRMDLEDRLKWDMACLEDRLYEGRGSRPRELVMKAREARDRMMKWRPGYWQ
ncbi:MAG: class I SAM-dependent methyltransferase [Polyangia bacterium]|jgi:SAM-dependent methyltransferase|nr:class I SAM-dependent methyltransferase [Polyangia bacterium]